MVSNRISSYREMRYCPLSCGNMEESSNAKKEVSEQLSKPASQRKDTKDSGYGDFSCECEEDTRNLPDWCRQCLIADGSDTIREDENDRSSLYRGSGDEDGDCVGDSDKMLSGINDSISVTANEDFENHGERYCKKSTDFESGTGNFMASDELQMTRSARKSPKPHQRQRRMTPVPLSAPLKLALTSSPDCLFVEEEDKEDIQIFNLEDEFVDQGFLQLTSSPRSSPLLAQRSFNNHKTTEPHKMEGGSAHIRNSPLLLKSTNEEREIKQSPEAARRHRLELVAGKAENIPERDHIFGNSMKEKCQKSEEVEEEIKIQSVCEGEESMMSSKEIPHIELESAVSLPDWMKKAKEETVNSDEAFADIHEQGDKNQDQLCVKMRTDGLQPSRKPESWTDQEATEDIIKIYTPQRYYGDKKQKRNRKLTPARATSPSLEKLADLHQQLCAFTVAEQDCD